MKKFLLFFPVFFVGLLGLALFWYKHTQLQIPLTRSYLTEVWALRAKINFTGEGKRATASLRLPKEPDHFKKLSEEFSSGEFGLATVIHQGERRAEWSAKALEGPVKLEYELKVVSKPEAQRRPFSVNIPEELPISEKLLDELKLEYFPPAKKKDKAPVSKISERFFCDLLKDEVQIAGRVFKGIDSAKGRKERAALIHSALSTPARLVQGVLIRESSRSVIRRSWLEIMIDGIPTYFDADRCLWITPSQAKTFFPWSIGAEEIVSVKGSSDLNLNMVGGPIAELSALQRQARNIYGGSLVGLSIYALPAEIQGTYRTLLLLPLGALVIAVVRSVIGMQSFGTFMPVLIALAFRETGLSMGLLFFIGIIGVSLFVRKYFELLQLLVVPRLSAMLHVVIVLLVAIGFATHILSEGRSVIVAILPVVVLTMAIERTALLWEEMGTKKALMVIAQSLILSVICYLVLSNSRIEYLLFMFPELLLVGLAISVVLGRYTGYRLTEVYRFRSFSTDPLELKRSDADRGAS